MEFIYNNALTNTASFIESWFDENHIPLDDWPPYSPNLNIIEYD